MNIKYLHSLLKNEKLLKRKTDLFERKGIIKLSQPNINEIKGHLLKAEHNLAFVLDNLKIGYFDWCITGCYYAIYHAALALLSQKGYSSKSHDATLCLLIKEYHKKGIGLTELEVLNRLFLDYQDLLFYVKSRNKREEASYSSTYIFSKETVEKYRQESIAFINKARDILQQEEKGK